MDSQRKSNGRLVSSRCERRLACCSDARAGDRPGGPEGRARPTVAEFALATGSLMVRMSVTMLVNVDGLAASFQAPGQCGLECAWDDRQINRDVEVGEDVEQRKEWLVGPAHIVVADEQCHRC